MAFCPLLVNTEAGLEYLLGSGKRTLRNKLQFACHYGVGKKGLITKGLLTKDLITKGLKQQKAL